MKLENIINDLKKIKETDGCTHDELLKEYISKLENELRLETCYKTSPKEKINAIKRFFKTVDDPRVLYKGFKRISNNKIWLCNGYMAYELNYFEIPAKEVVEEIPDNAEKDKYIKGQFIDLSKFFNENIDIRNQQVKLDFNDIVSHYKLYKLNKPYELKMENESYKLVSPIYLKNIIDILGKSTKAITTENENDPIYFSNDKGEQAMLLPIRKRN